MIQDFPLSGPERPCLQLDLGFASLNLDLPFFFWGGGGDDTFSVFLISRCFDLYFILFYIGSLSILIIQKFPLGELSMSGPQR